MYPTIRPILNFWFDNTQDKFSYATVSKTTFDILLIGGYNLHNVFAENSFPLFITIFQTFITILCCYK